MDEYNLQLKYSREIYHFLCGSAPYFCRLPRSRLLVIKHISKNGFGSQTGADRQLPRGIAQIRESHAHALLDSVADNEVSR